MEPKYLAGVFLVVLLSFQSSQPVHGEKILFFWGMSGYSHRITIWPLIEKLANRGHQITFFSPYKSKTPVSHPNITEMTPAGLLKQTGMDFDPAEVRLTKGMAGVDALWPQYLEGGIQVCQMLAEDKELLEWAKTATFDLVVINGLFNDCGYGFAWKLKAPTIVYGTSSLFPWWGEVYVR